MNQKPPTALSYSRILALISRFGLDPFVVALLGAIVLAKLWPEPGIQEGVFSLSELAGYGVLAVFFLYGLRLDPQKLAAGLRNWKLHLVIHFVTFLLFPLLGLAGYTFFSSAGTAVIWLGIFYLSALPSTVSSSVVMVSIAGGNIPAAIFNASISSLIGVFITPLWVGLVLSASQEGFDLGPIILKLMLQILLPVILGLLLHSRFGKMAERHKSKLRLFDQSIILIIIYTSFSGSFSRNLFQDFSFQDIALLSGGILAFFLLVLAAIYFGTRWLKFTREDTITAMFCGTQKSLVQGTIMAKVLFAGAGFTGIVLLPVMIYHALQLIVTSFIAGKMARNLATPEEKR